MTETSGTAAELPPPTKGELAAIGSSGSETRDIVSQSGKPFLSLVVRVAATRAEEPPQYMQVAMERLAQKRTADALTERETGLVTAYDRARFVRPDSWAMFSPTELLKEYLGAAFSKEGV
ncbi:MULTISPECIES: hypothetical protein [unclassified Bradyrhizobium]|uniref:hypothetical protein n=1 Tax=unclassified Bradyrhizobium TaxID=2631580 RepID=UPI00247ACC9C|nr:MULTISPECIES: hypothetical protein [unclassified Bradyrhizobium]WGS22960.1 hypothetical protein MTX22_15690 [Bradyrhizobium sp. ISRA463]WGS29961.1 hypothetical protein MTX19_13430 [Bradyrhizobium sp. ISRA464]